MRVIQRQYVRTDNAGERSVNGNSRSGASRKNAGNANRASASQTVTRVATEIMRTCSAATWSQNDIRTYNIKLFNPRGNGEPTARTIYGRDEVITAELGGAVAKIVARRHIEPEAANEAEERHEQREAVANRQRGGIRYSSSETRSRG